MFINPRRLCSLLACLAIAALLSPDSRAQIIRLKKLDAKAPDNTIEIRGVSPDPFNPKLWNQSPLNFLPDIRHPLLDPRDGALRNIYAPTIPHLSSGSFRIFYGGWDGTPTGNDRIYSADTSDFLTFTNRHTVIEHGPFQHVCNVNVTRIETGAFAMMCTACPDAKGL